MKKGREGGVSEGGWEGGKKGKKEKVTWFRF